MNGGVTERYSITYSPQNANCRVMSNHRKNHNTNVVNAGKRDNNDMRE
jgi:hypothetical protein